MAALVVAALVASAAPAASAAGGAVSESPPPYEDAVAEGWLPHPLPAPAVPRVAFVGDSIGRDAQHYVRNQVGRTHQIAYYHAVAAGYIGYHLPRLRPVVEAPGGPDILLVELGTGDAFWDHGPAQFERDVRRFLDKVLPHVTCVRWFDQKPTANIAYPHVNEHRTEFNRILRRVLSEPRYRSANVALVPYSAWFWRSGDQGFFLEDRLHHTQAGRRELGLLAGQAVEGCDPAHTSGPFWDVPDRSSAATAVDWLGTNGIVEPYRNGTFRERLGSFPVDLDRGQLARYLWRLAQSPSGSPPTTWRDVPSSLRPAVSWVQASGIMRGFADGTFRASNRVTRTGLAVYLWRAMQRPTEGVTHRTWTDVPAELVPAVDWAVSTGIMAPYAGGAFGSDRVVTRSLGARTLYALVLHITDLLAEAAAPSTTTTSLPGSVPTTTAAPPPATVPTTTAPTVAPSTTTVAPTTSVPVPSTTVPAGGP